MCAIPNIFRKLYKNFMDRRQKKTREAIFSAFSKLLETRKYENITVQDIIDLADVGRSTFYSHFETKDHLLYALCSDIFNHIFEGAVCDYEAENRSLESTLSHILWHLREHKSDISGLLCSESGELFMKYISKYMSTLFEMYIDDFHADVPRDFLINYLTGSFVQTVRWWVGKGMETSPEDTARYFMNVVETH